MATAKQRAWRAKFARMYGGKKKRRTTTRRARRASPARATRRTHMARRRSYRRKGRRRSNPLGSVKRIVKLVGGAILLSGVATQFLPVGGLPKGTVQGASGFLLGGVPGAIAGFASAYVLPMLVGGGSGSSEGSW